MKQYTHAWLALMAIKRLEKAKLPVKYQKRAHGLVTWFMNHRDSVVQGAWYPDAIIKDMATSHILKYQPDPGSKFDSFRRLPTSMNLYKIGKESPQYKKPYKYMKGNLPDRCESLAHGIIDKLKMQESEPKGSPISPTDNHIATAFFMLSHYIADAHMPLHCDVRPFSDGSNIHAHIEKEWDKEVRDSYKIDFENERFYYDPEGYPLRTTDHQSELCDYLEDELINRAFTTGWGTNNKNTWDYMKAVTQYSYLTAYKMIPEGTNEELSWSEFKQINSGYTLDEYNKMLLMDAIDSIAKIWLRIWVKYMKWKNR